jgi:hypothetical protein
MSSAKFSMRLDEKNQVIRQFVEGVIDDEDSESIKTMTERLSAGLKDPHKIRVLTVSNDIGKASSKARRSLLKNMEDPDLYKIAVMGNNPYMKILFSFILKATRIKKARVFTDEHEAVRWLQE